MKKVWRFFDKMSGLSKPTLVAMTTEKKLAKDYVTSRDMENIIQRVDKFDEDELLDYLQDNRKAVLRYETLQSYLNKNTDRQTPIKVDVLMTEFEYMTIDELAESGVFGLLEYTMVRPDIFKKSIIDALKEIDYVDAYKLLNMDTVMCSGDEWEIPDINWNFDMLALFMFVYDENLNHDGFLETIRYKKRDTK